MTVAKGEFKYERGMFVAYEPGSDIGREIKFRFNPESISRSITLETAGGGGGGVEGAAPGGAAPAGASASAGEASGDAKSGTVKESFSIQIRLDFADREGKGLDEKLGIAPEIAAIEDLMYPAETERDASSDGSNPVRPARDRPTVYLQWGPRRRLPVRIVSLKIDESVYNAQLNPVRAEIEASLEVLGAAEALGNKSVESALALRDKNRRDLAGLYHDTRASQDAATEPAASA